ncbi:MAG: hypothetical protein AB7K09_18165 [Planctomycetota bacterium]
MSKFGTGQLAEQTGISQRTLQHLAKGNQDAKGEQLHSLLVATGCSAVWLLNGDGQPFPTVKVDHLSAAQNLASAQDGLAELIEQLGQVLDALHPLLTKAQRARLSKGLRRIGSRYVGE